MTVINLYMSNRARVNVSNCTVFFPPIKEM